MGYQSNVSPRILATGDFVIELWKAVAERLHDMAVFSIFKARAIELDMMLDIWPRKWEDMKKRYTVAQTLDDMEQATYLLQKVQKQRGWPQRCQRTMAQASPLYTVSNTDSE